MPADASTDFGLNLVFIIHIFRDEMALAKTWVLLIQNQTTAKSTLSSEKRWARIQAQIPIYERKKQRSRVLRSLFRWTASAAAILLFIMVTYDVSQFGTKETNTAFGEQRELSLPDSSIIRLNSNSHISYVRSWKTDKPREVGLKEKVCFR